MMYVFTYKITIRLPITFYKVPNQLLPLQCIRTIRRYLAMVSNICGFDKCLFELFKKHLAFNKDHQKHGLLIIHFLTGRT